MQQFYFSLLICLVMTQLIFVAIKPALIFEYPYFMAAVFAVFILPQAYSLIRFPGGVHQESITDVLLMSNLCLGCALIGYRFAPSGSVVRLLTKSVYPNRLFTVAMIFILVGTAASFLIPRTAVKFNELGGMTGRITIFLFFGSLVVPGFAIVLMLLRQKFTPGRLAAVILGSLVPVLSLVFGRREAAVVFFLTIALSAYYTKRKAPRALVVFSLLFFAMIAIPATSAYRSLVSKGEANVTNLKRIRPIENFVEFFTQESILELRNAAAVIEESRRFHDYDFGAGYWNQIVFRFVPAQLTSREFKDSLMIYRDLKDYEKNELKTGYEMSPGSTLTGMGDAYQHFGWFGCLFFAALGLLFKSAWTAAMQPNATFPQVFYIMICSSAMRTVTHQTTDFLPGMIFFIIFLGLGYLYAAVPAQPPAPAPRVRPRGSRWN